MAEPTSNPRLFDFDERRRSHPTAERVRPEDAPPGEIEATLGQAQAASRGKVAATLRATASATLRQNEPLRRAVLRARVEAARTASGRHRSPARRPGATRGHRDRRVRRGSVRRARAPGRSGSDGPEPPAGRRPARSEVVA